MSLINGFIDTYVFCKDYISYCRSVVNAKVMENRTNNEI